MSIDKTGIVVRGMAPLLQVFDMPASIRFYRDIIGFEVISTSNGPTPPDENYDWALLSINEIQLMLNTAYEHDSRPDAPDPTRTASHQDTSIYFGCPDVEAAYEYIINKGLKIEKPHITHYGFKEIHFSDPDGYELVFHWPVNETR